MDTITSNQNSTLIEDFLNFSIIEAQTMRTKLRSRIEDLITEGDTEELSGSLELFNSLQPAFEVIDSYNFLINTLIHKNKNKSKLITTFLPDNLKQEKDLILQLYPQSMPLSHYVELFNLCGYAPLIDLEKISQITVKRLYAYQKFQVINKEIYLQDSYTFGELFGIVKKEKIEEIIEEYWSEGRLDTLQFIAMEKGGRLISSENNLKVFEVETKEKDTNGNPIYHLIYVTPSFYAFQPEDVFNQQKGKYYFLNKEPRVATSMVETEKTLFRHHFVKPIGDSDDLRFKIRINLAMNLFRFKVTKVMNNEK